MAWDRRTGRPLHRAIVWQDRRTAARCDELREAGHEPLIREATGLVLDPYFTATKAEWLLTQGGVAESPDLALGTVDAWVLWNLTGGVDGGTFATEPSNASRTMLFDIRRLAWSDELLDLFGVPAAALPEVLPSSGRFGMTAASSGLPAGLPVSGIAGDQQAALFGQACLEAGMTKNTYGTGSFVLMNVGAACPAPVEGLLTTVAWTLADGSCTYALEGAIFVTGAAVQWLRDGLGIISEAAEVAELAATVPDANGCVLVPAFTGLGSPWWDPYARGTITGITRGTNRGAPGPGRAGVDVPADARRRRGHERGVGSPCPGAQGRRRSGGQRPPAPAPGRPPAGAGVAAGHPGDDGSGRCLPGRSGRGGLVLARRDHCQLAARRRRSSRSSTPRRPMPSTPPGCGLSIARAAGPATEP